MSLKQTFLPYDLAVKLTSAKLMPIINKGGGMQLKWSKYFRVFRVRELLGIVRKAACLTRFLIPERGFEVLSCKIFIISIFIFQA